MIYATASLWLLASIVMAWGVHHLWRSLMNPRALNVILWPASIAAHVGRILALLLTGSTWDGTGGSIGSKDKKETDNLPRPKVPFVGPVLVALFPLAILTVLLYVVVMRLGQPLVAKLPSDRLATALPSTLGALWEQVRGLVTLSEAVGEGLRGFDGPFWQVVIFVYLLACLSVRLAPFPGNLRGHLGAVAAVGVLAWLGGTLMEQMPQVFLRAWPLLALVVGWLLLLLLLSLLVKGVVVSVQMVLRGQ